MEISQSSIKTEAITEGMAVPLVKIPIKLKSDSNSISTNKVKIEKKKSLTNEKLKISNPDRLHLTFPEQDLMFVDSDKHNNNYKFYVAFDFFKIKYPKNPKDPKNPRNPEEGIPTWVKQYAYFEHPNQLLNLNLSIKAKNYNELIRSNTPVRPGWDIEWYTYPHLPSNPSDLIFKTLLDAIVQTVSNVFSKSVEPQHLRISQSHKLSSEYNKYSFHINLCGYGCLPNHKFFSGNLTKIIINSLGSNPIFDHCYDRENMKQKFPLDESIYSENRCFRLLGHHKGDEIDRPLQPMDGHQNYSPLDFLLSWTQGESNLDVSGFSLYDSRNVSLKKSDARSGIFTSNIRSTSAHQLGVNSDDNAVSLFTELHPDSELVSIKEAESGWLFYNFSKSEHLCLLCHRVHQGNRQYLVVDPKKGTVIYKCYDEDGKDRRIYLQKPRKSLIESDVTINTNQLPEYDFHNRKCLIIDSEVGTGKTIELGKYLEKIGATVNVLCLTYRVSLSHKYLSELGKLGFKNYLDAPKRRIDDGRLIIQLDSLYRIDWSRREWHVLVIDEIDSVLSHFNSSLMKRKNQNAEVFSYLMNQSQQCLLMDANARSDRVCDLILSMFGRDQIYCLVNTYIRPHNRSLRVLKHKDRLLDLYMESLKKGENVIMISTSKEFLKELEKISRKCFPNEKLLFYTSETDRKQLMEDGLNANEAWKSARGLHYTPTISAGISFTLEHFDRLFIYGGSGGCEASTLFQMMFRVRQLRTGEMYMYLNPSRQRLPIEFNEVERFIRNVHNEIYYDSGESYIQRKIAGSQGYFYPEKDWKYRLYINNLISKFRSENNFSRELIDRLSRMLIPIIYDDSEPDQDIKDKISTERKIARELLRSEKVELIMKSPVIDQNQFDLLKELSKHQKLSMEQEMSVLKYYVCQIYQVDASKLTIEFVDKYADHKVIHQYLNRCKMSSNDLQSQVNQLVKKDLKHNLTQIDNCFSYFDEKHESFDLLLSYMFLCQILKVTSLKTKDLKTYEVTGQQLYNYWQPYQGIISEKIETWSYKLRDDRSKLIKKEQCLKWDNQSFLKFINSIIDEKLGLQLKRTYKHPRDAMRNKFGLCDLLDFDSPNTPQLRELKVNDTSALPKGICLL